MILYLSSFQLGNNPQRLKNMLSHNNEVAVIVIVNAIDVASPIR